MKTRGDVLGKSARKGMNDHEEGFVVGTSFCRLRTFIALRGLGGKPDLCIICLRTTRTATAN